MLALAEVDGLVSGAVHSTANTIRPAFADHQNQTGCKGSSRSIFFMCLPDQVLVYGDCAVNPDPDAETLADIAIKAPIRREVRHPGASRHDQLFNGRVGRRGGCGQGARSNEAGEA